MGLSSQFKGNQPREKQISPLKCGHRESQRINPRKFRSCVRSIAQSMSNRDETLLFPFQRTLDKVLIQKVKPHGFMNSTRISWTRSLKLLNSSQITSMPRAVGQASHYSRPKTISNMGTLIILMPRIL